MENFVLYNELERNENSVLYKGRKKGTIHFLGIQCIDKYLAAYVNNMARLMIDIKHENIVEFKEWYETNKHYWLILELCTGESLELVIERDKCLPESCVRDFAVDIAKGLHHIHTLDIIFADLQPSKIWLNNLGVLKLADFSLSKIEHENLDHIFESFSLPDTYKSKDNAYQDFPESLRYYGNLKYLAPELLKGGQQSKASDLWALGCIMFQMFTGHPPFFADTYRLLRKKILEQEIPFPQIAGNAIHLPPSAEAMDLMKGLLCKDERRRYTWSVVLQHPFWKGRLVLLMQHLHNNDCREQVSPDTNDEPLKRSILVHRHGKKNERRASHLGCSGYKELRKQIDRQHSFQQQLVYQEQQFQKQHQPHCFLQHQRDFHNQPNQHNMELDDEKSHQQQLDVGLTIQEYPCHSQRRQLQNNYSQQLTGGDELTNQVNVEQMNKSVMMQTDSTDRSSAPSIPESMQLNYNSLQRQSIPCHQRSQKLQQKPCFGQLVRDQAQLQQLHLNTKQFMSNEEIFNNCEDVECDDSLCNICDKNDNNNTTTINIDNNNVNNDTIDKSDSNDNDGDDDDDEEKENVITIMTTEISVPLKHNLTNSDDEDVVEAPENIEVEEEGTIIGDDVIDDDVIGDDVIDGDVIIDGEEDVENEDDANNNGENDYNQDDFTFSSFNITSSLMTEDEDDDNDEEGIDNDHFIQKLNAKIVGGTNEEDDVNISFLIFNPSDFKSYPLFKRFKKEVSFKYDPKLLPFKCHAGEELKTLQPEQLTIHMETIYTSLTRLLMEKNTHVSRTLNMLNYVGHVVQSCVEACDWLVSSKVINMLSRFAKESTRGVSQMLSCQVMMTMINSLTKINPDVNVTEIFTNLVDGGRRSGTNTNLELMFLSVLGHLLSFIAKYESDACVTHSSLSSPPTVHLFIENFLQGFNTCVGFACSIIEEVSLYSGRHALKFVKMDVIRKLWMVYEHGSTEGVKASAISALSRLTRLNNTCTIQFFEKSDKLRDLVLISTTSTNNKLQQSAMTLLLLLMSSHRGGPLTSTYKHELIQYLLKLLELCGGKNINKVLNKNINNLNITNNLNIINNHNNRNYSDKIVIRSKVYLCINLFLQLHQHLMLFACQNKLLTIIKKDLEEIAEDELVEATMTMMMGNMTLMGSGDGHCQQQDYQQQQQHHQQQHQSHQQQHQQQHQPHQQQHQQQQQHHQPHQHQQQQHQQQQQHHQPHQHQQQHQQHHQQQQHQQQQQQFYHRDCSLDYLKKCLKLLLMSMKDSMQSIMNDVEHALEGLVSKKYWTSGQQEEVRFMLVQVETIQCVLLSEVTKGESVMKMTMMHSTFARDLLKLLKLLVVIELGSIKLSAMIGQVECGNFMRSMFACVSIFIQHPKYLKEHLNDVMGTINSTYSKHEDQDGLIVTLLKLFNVLRGDLKCMLFGLICDMVMLFLSEDYNWTCGTMGVIDDDHGDGDEDNDVRKVVCHIVSEHLFHILPALLLSPDPRYSNQSIRLLMLIVDKIIIKPNIYKCHIRFTDELVTSIFQLINNNKTNLITDQVEIAISIIKDLVYNMIIDINDFYDKGFADFLILSIIELSSTCLSTQHQKQLQQHSEDEQVILKSCDDDDVIPFDVYENNAVEILLDLLNILHIILKRISQVVKNVLEVKSPINTPSCLALSLPASSSSSPPLTKDDAEQLLLRNKVLCVFVPLLTHLLLHNNEKVSAEALKCLALLVQFYGGQHKHSLCLDNQECYSKFLQKCDLKTKKLILKFIKRFIKTDKLHLEALKSSKEASTMFQTISSLSSSDNSDPNLASLANEIIELVDK